MSHLRKRKAKKINDYETNGNGYHKTARIAKRANREDIGDSRRKKVTSYVTQRRHLVRVGELICLSVRLHGKERVKAWY